MATKNKVLPQEPQVPEVNETENPVEEIVTGGEFKDVVKRLTEKYGKPKKVTIKNVNFEHLDTYCRVSLTLRQNLPAYVNKGGDEFVKDEHNVIFSSTYAVAGMLKETDDYAWIGNIIIAKPEIINLIFSAATIGVIQQEVEANEEYVNPFSTDGTITTKEYPWIVNHIVSIELSKVGEKVADRLMDKILDC